MSPPDMPGGAAVVDPTGGAATPAAAEPSPAATGAPSGAAAPLDGGAAAASPAPAAAEPAPAPAAAAEPAPAAAAEPAKDGANAHATETLLEAATNETPKPAEGTPAEGAADPAKAEPAKPADPAAAAEPAKPADDAKPAADAKPADGAAAAEPVAAAVVDLIKYEFKLPEGVKADSEDLKGFTAYLGEHRVAPEVGQELLNRHATAMKQYGEHVAAEQHRAWSETRKAWRDEALADPEIGGAGHQTAMRAIARMRDLAVQQKDLPAFNEFLRVTGAGDHPAFLKMLHTFARWFDEPASTVPVGNPTATNGKAPKVGRGLQAIYQQRQQS